MLTKPQMLSSFIDMVQAIGGRLGNSLNDFTDYGVQDDVRRSINMQITNCCQSYTLIDDWMIVENKC